MYNVSIACQDWSIDQRVKILVVSQFNLMHVSPTVLNMPEVWNNMFVCITEKILTLYHGLTLSVVSLSGVFILLNEARNNT